MKPFRSVYTQILLTFIVYSQLPSVNRYTGCCLEHVYAFSCKTHLFVVRLNQQHISAVRSERRGGGGGGRKGPPRPSQLFKSTFVVYVHCCGASVAVTSQQNPFTLCQKCPIKLVDNCSQVRRFWVHYFDALNKSTK